MAIGANDFTLEELEEIFKGEGEQETPPADDGKSPTEPSTPEGNNDGKTTNVPVDQTKAFSHRLKESVSKKVAEERENIAKTMGYDSYDAMLKSKEVKLIKDKGYDPSELEPLIEQLLENRLKNHPGLKELESYKQRQAEEYAKKELADLTKLTGGEITSLEQLPKAVLDEWAKTGSLKSAYLQIEGEKLITKVRSSQSKGDTTHLKSPQGGTPPPTNTRPLTAEEKSVWKYFNPGMTEEELNKKTVPVE